MKEIVLTRGLSAIVDDEDYGKVNAVKWFAMACGYAAREEHGKTVLMHRVIMDTPQGLQVDHINGNRLDNRRANLRNVTRAQNMKNTGTYVSNTSGYKGVSWKKQALRWRAQIRANGKKLHLGYFVSPQEANEAYKAAAIKYFGEFARENITEALK